MISLFDQPYIVELVGNDSADGEEILLLAIGDPDSKKGLILAARELIWHPLDQMLVKTTMASYELLEDLPDEN